MAIEQARELQPDLVLLDLSMPTMDGLEALPLIHEAAPATDVVILSGFQEKRMAETVDGLGALGYIEKGLDPASFVQRLNGLLDGTGTGPGPLGTAEDEQGRTDVAK